MNQNSQLNQSRQSQKNASRGSVFTKKLYKNNYSYLKILIPYLDNPFEEAISESN